MAEATAAALALAPPLLIPAEAEAPVEAVVGFHCLAGGWALFSLVDDTEEDTSAILTLDTVTPDRLASDEAAA